MLRTSTEKVLPNDLSELYEGKLEITIKGVGTQIMIFKREPLAKYVAHPLFTLTNNFVYCNEISNSQWEIISFDRANRKLVVRPVK